MVKAFASFFNRPVRCIKLFVFSFTLAALSLLVFMQPAGAQVAVSPASFSTQNGLNTTGLAWGNFNNGVAYVGTTITASGGAGITSANPYQWSLKINGLTVQSCTTSRCATPPYQHTWVQTHAGQLDADGDTGGTNHQIVYIAPQDFPSNQQVQVCATDGTTSACSTATIPYGPFPASWATHRARMLGMQNQPWSAINGGGTVPTYQSGFVFFPNPFLPGEYMGIVATTPGIAQFPTTAGSDINRPAWSYNGKLFAYGDTACVPVVFCPSTNASVNWVGPTGLRGNFNDGIPGWSTYTWDYHKPTWMLYENFTADPQSTVSVLDLDGGGNTATQVFAASSINKACTSETDYCEPVLKSQMGGTDLSRNALVETNHADEKCFPTATNSLCQTAGGSIQVAPFDMTPCESTLAANCATTLTAFNMGFALGAYTSGTIGDCSTDITSPSQVGGTSNYYDANGVPHQVYCEWGVHDWYYRRGTNKIIWNYGAHGSGGEPDFFEANDDGTGVQQLYPNQANNLNYAYWSHPAFNSTGSLVEAAASIYCGANGAHPCASYTSGITHINLNGPSNCPAVPADYPALNANCNVLRFVKKNTTQFQTDYGHAAWDGWDNNHSGHDARAYVGSLPEQHQWLMESFWNPAMGTSAPQDTTVYDFGENDGGTAGIFSPTQSPDGTKLAYSYPISTSAVDNPVPYEFWTRTPEAPVNVLLASTTAAQIQWTPAALSHEAEQLWVWKQPACSGAWSRLASIAAVYLQTSPYSYTDSGLGAGSSACYGVTSVEWSGAESNVLSNVIGVTNTSGSFAVTSRVPSGTVNFDTTTPGAVTGFSASSVALCSTAAECSGTISQPSPITSISPDPQLSTTLSNAVFGSTTSTTSVSPGAATITVGTTAGLVSGMDVLVDVGAAQEGLRITGLTSTTITGTFLYAHTEPFAVASLPQVVNVASGTNLVANETLTIDTAGNQETVYAQLVNAAGNWFEATFTKNHAAGAAVVSAGGLTAGTYNIEYTYCKYTDFPLDSACSETLTSAHSSAVAAANGVIDFATQRNEMAGQDGYCIYAELVGTDSNYHKDGCFHLPDYANQTQIRSDSGAVSNANAGWFQPLPEGNVANGFAGSMHIVLQSHNSAGAIPPSSNATLGGYKLAWTLPADQDLRYVLVLYSEGAAPSASNPWPFEIAAAPATSTTFYDGYPNQAPAGHIYYALETLDSEGKLGGCVAYDATAGSTASCRP